MEVSKAYLFSLSTRNTKIESWWAQLVASKVRSLKEMFKGYNITGSLCTQCTTLPAGSSLALAD
jgi:hypothetical protein